MAARIIDPNLLDFVPLEGDYLVRDVVLPEACQGHSLMELDLRSCFDLLIVAVRRTKEPHFVFLPGPDYVPQAEDVMVMIGREQDMVTLERAKDFPVCPVRVPGEKGRRTREGVL